MGDRLAHLLDDDDDNDDTSHKEGSRLCKICDQIGMSDARWLKVRHGIRIYIHRRDLHSLKSSALNECRLCQLILSTVVNSDDAENAAIISGDNSRDSGLILGTKKSLFGDKRLPQAHRHDSSLLFRYFLPIALREFEAIQGLNRLSELCGKGRVLLIDKDWPDVLPDDLRAVVLYPFGAFDSQDAHKPFVTGLPFELATDYGMRNVLA